MMGLRFKKSIKIFPGVSVNLSSKDISLSIGTEGAKLNINKDNAKATASIPGTGISYIKQIGANPRSK